MIELDQMCVSYAILVWHKSVYFKDMVIFLYRGENMLHRLYIAFNLLEVDIKKYDML